MNTGSNNAAADTSSENSCPSWCEASGCRGEHRTVTTEPIPATAGLPRRASSGGFYFPGIRVDLVWDEIDGLSPAIALWVTSEKDDADAELHLREAKRLHEELDRAIAILEATLRGDCNVATG